MRFFLFACLFLTMLISADSAAPVPPGTYAARWKKIDALLRKDQTATAAPLVETIYQQAKKAGDNPAYVRALLYKVRLLHAKQEDADEKAIALLEAELPTATFPARPILHSLLAGLYTSYLDEHRYALYQRTAGAAPTADGRPADGDAAADGGTGLATWNVGRLGAAIVRHYYQSVEDEPQRQLKTTLASLGDLAVGGDAEGRALRPTLYDLLAQRAIEGLKNQELYVTRPEQQFQPTEPKLFGTAEEFAALRLLAPEADSLNGQLHALHLLQRLTASRQQLAPQNRAALADVDLSRVDYLHGLTAGTDLAAQYAPALVRLAETYKELPISTEFMARRVELLQITEPVVAVRLAHEAEARFPKSRGAVRARQVRGQIELPEVSFSADDVVLADKPWRLQLQVRNVAELHVWAYRISLKEWENSDQYEEKNRTVTQRYARALRAVPAVAWVVPVPAYPHPHAAQVLAVAGAALPLGHYLVVIGNEASPPIGHRPGTVAAFGFVGASALSAVVRRDPATGAAQLLALHRQSGAVLPNIRVQAHYRHYEPDKRQWVSRADQKVDTDTQGMARFPLPTEIAYREAQMQYLRLTRGGDTLQFAGLSRTPIYGGAGGLQAQRHTFLFTDRAIYRPGQTLYYKGILTETRGAKSSLVTSQPVSVRLVDVNGQTVQTLPFTTSDFGSFHGSVVLPVGLLNGEMSLQTDQGSVSFAVEDYKRPTFLVSLDSVPGRPQLGQPVVLTGRARAYAGQATDGASVKYRITRRELWPMFDYDFGGRGIYRPGGNRGSQEIAHGTTTTDAEGRFSITFTPPLLPKTPGRNRGWEPGYLFEITADVTDAAGETRTATRQLAIGRNPLSLRLVGPAEMDRQHLPALTLLGTNATGEPLPAVGTLRLLARRYRPNPPGVPGPAPETADNEAPPTLVKTLPFDTKASAQLAVAALLADVPTGRYRLEARAAGRDSAARAQLDFTLYDAQATTVPYATPDWFVALADTVAPGQATEILLGSSEAGARILLEVERAGQLLRSEWLTLNASEQRRLRLESGPADAVGPLYVHTTQVRDGRLYRHEATVQVAEPPQPLQVSIATFRDRLQPGQKETWRVTIRQANGQPAEAELLATLYDQSLDVFRAHSFMGLDFERGYYPARFGWQGAFGEVNSRELFGNRTSDYSNDVRYPELRTWEIWLQEELRDKVVSRMVVQGNADMAMAAAPAPMAARTRFAPPVIKRDEEMVLNESMADTVAGRPGAKPAAPDLAAVPTRSDFRETAFWQPALRTDKNGDVVLEFQLPEAVTRWQLLALAHDKTLRTGQLARQLVTQKEIQITPNAPRFLRPGDTFTFPAKFSNLTDHATHGTAQLVLLDAATGQDLTAQLLKGPAQQPVAAAAHQSAALGWELSIPADFAPVAVTYRVVAQAGNTEEGKGNKEKGRKQNRRQAPLPTGEVLGVGFSDGEENTLPVLPNRILITESLPLPIVGPGTREFELTKLTSTSSATRRNYSLTLELTANPAWYAVQSLPYLMEYPYECSEQTFSRLYANLLAAQILKANPRFKTVLAEWTRQARSGTAAQRNALESKLAQNQELKNLLLQETPWVRDAQGETARLARLAELFDETRLQAETRQALLKLQRQQLPNGAFPWFERMPADRYITQLIVAGFGKLRKLGAFDASQDATAQALLQQALRYLDAELGDDYARLRRTKNVKLADNHLADEHIQALYARSFWPQQPEAPAAKVAYAYYRSQAASYWPAQTRYLQAQIALALHRADANRKPAPAKAPAAAEILRALAENALHSSEQGMYWKEVRGGYYWREAPTETQATLIEAFDEVRNDQKSVDEMKLWLLKQKQTHSWESTRATADACYALLLRGSDWLVPTQPLQVTVGGQEVRPEAAQAGTGYVKTSWPAAEIKPAQGKVTVRKPDAGVAWGALYWQYFEDLDQVTAAATALSLERQLYREVPTAGGPVLEKLTPATPLKIGDALVVRLVLRTDRALEYVHLKDQRAAGLEPIQQTSGYRYQNGLGYYESPRDAATNFFLSEVPRGTHVFEYRLRASQAGDFSGGLSQAQCLYAPEFGTQSAGQRLRINP